MYLSDNYSHHPFVIEKAACSASTAYSTCLCQAIPCNALLHEEPVNTIASYPGVILGCPRNHLHWHYSELPEITRSIRDCVNTCITQEPKLT